MFPQQNFGGPFWSNGPSMGSFYNFPGSVVQDNRPTEYKPQGIFGTQHASRPITTGTSVLGLKFDGGVMIAADSLVSYGSLARYHNVERVYEVNNQTIIGCGIDFADFQYIKRFIDQRVIDDVCLDDKNQLKPKSLYNWLTRVLYNKRSKFEPLWLDLIIGGMEDGVPFLGHVNFRGRAYTADVVSTGYGGHLALPLLREYSEGPKKAKFTRQEAHDLMNNCMSVLFYRDCRGHPKYVQAVCTKAGVEVQKDLTTTQNWGLAASISGY